MNRTDFIVYKSAGIEIRKILLIDLFYLWQNYVKNTTPKNWKIGKHSEPQKRSVFGRRIGPKLKKLRFFSEGEYRLLVLKKFE